MRRTFVGFGFGPIQAGLFVFEAFRSGNFSRLAVSEIDRTLVEAIRLNQGSYALNIAHADGIEAVQVTGLEIYDPGDAHDRGEIIAAIGESQELATAVPSVESYGEGGEASIVHLLAEGVDTERTRVIYAAENHNFAAQILRQAVLRERPGFPVKTTRFLNTVIGKMSRSVTDASEIGQLGLTPLAPGLSRAVLVEAFNRILVSRVRLPGFRRGIEAFEEKESLLPFEEAKLYGHNAVHALLAYLGYTVGYDSIAQAARNERIIRTAREAFLNESGAALRRKHADLGDPLFTDEGYRAYAQDLLQRMANPHLNDTVERVAREPVRKLAYSDRIFGTMRLALEFDIQPTNMALAAAGALLYLKQEGRPVPMGQAPTTVLSAADAEDALWRIWGEEAKEDDKASRLISLTKDALVELAKFQAPSCDEEP